MSFNYCKTIPDDVLRLCCKVFRSHIEALKASIPAGEGHEVLCWAVLESEPVTFNDPRSISVDLTPYTTHSIRLVQQYPGEWVWMLEDAGDRAEFERLRKNHRGNFS